MQRAKPPLRNIFGRILRRAREQAGLTQRDLQRLVGIDRQTVVVYEMGLAVPIKDNLHRLVKALKIPAEEFVGARLAHKAFNSGLFQEVCLGNAFQIASQVMPTPGKTLNVDFFGALVRQLQRRLGIESSQDFARLLNVSETHVRQYAKNFYFPNVQGFVNSHLANLLNVHCGHDPQDSLAALIANKVAREYRTNPDALKHAADLILGETTGEKQRRGDRTHFGSFIFQLRATLTQEAGSPISHNALGVYLDVEGYNLQRYETQGIAPIRPRFEEMKAALTQSHFKKHLEGFEITWIATVLGNKYSKYPQAFARALSLLKSAPVSATTGESPFAEMLKAVRKEYQLTEQELSLKLGIPMKRYENRGICPRQEHLQTIIEGMRVHFRKSAEEVGGVLLAAQAREFGSICRDLPKALQSAARLIPQGTSEGTPVQNVPRWINGKLNTFGKKLALLLRSNCEIGKVIPTYEGSANELGLPVDVLYRTVHRDYDFRELFQTEPHFLDKLSGGLGYDKVNLLGFLGIDLASERETSLGKEVQYVSHENMGVGYDLRIVTTTGSSDIRKIEAKAYDRDCLSIRFTPKEWQAICEFSKEIALYLFLGADTSDPKLIIIQNPNEHLKATHDEASGHYWILLSTIRAFVQDRGLDWHASLVEI